MMILMRIPLMMSGIGVIGGKIKADFGRDGMGCIVVEDRFALQLQKTYPKQYRALRIPKELTLAVETKYPQSINHFGIDYMNKSLCGAPFEENAFFCAKWESVDCPDCLSKREELESLPIIEFPQHPVAIAKPKRTRSPKGTRKGKGK